MAQARKTTKTGVSKTTTNTKQKEEMVDEIQEEVVVEQKEEKVEVKEPRVFKEDEGILCRSITRGELIHIGKKSSNRYIFSNHGDTCEIEVRDLNSLKASKSVYLYDPLFVIEDEEFLEQPKWKDVKTMYDHAIANDVDEILMKTNDEFEFILANLQKGYKDAVAREVATRIINNDFDSLGKIKIVDKICGTDLMCMIS